MYYDHWENNELDFEYYELEFFLLSLSIKKKNLSLEKTEINYFLPEVDRLLAEPFLNSNWKEISLKMRYSVLILKLALSSVDTLPIYQT